MLTTFEQFLINKERIQEKYVPYYVKWVSDCYRYHNLPESEPLPMSSTLNFSNALQTMLKTGRSGRLSVP